MTWQYIAGFFDGEGSLSKTSHSVNCWRARLGQKNDGVLYEIKQFLLSNEIDSQIIIGTGGKNISNLQVSSRREILVKFLSLIYPYLIVKRVLVQDVLRFFKLYPKLNRTKHKL